ncbi:EAL domain-containing protein [Agrobacterium tumefaciens]|uniref:putative bifunctional diguanylate cyclase/phosphodiesterase n=1 Tax=Agrobacterium tumefaciens TaxID=358 RepID=UPI001574A73D|nr:bifunctional diguanylate cyclase/phosphodiesterase [Agrobacterium tumefaciens]NTA84516.1 EAL domain-containing protein [Agrobacterium tumefaciens]
MIGQAVEMIIPERLRQAHASGFARAVAGEKLNLRGKPIEVYGRRKDGSEFPIELTLCAWRDNRGMGAAAVIRDISERREREGRLLRLASRDVMTGLHNCASFTELLAQAPIEGKSVSVIMLDLDGFKEVNEGLGYIVGDSLLQAAGVRLPLYLRPLSEVARFANDEFAILLPNACASSTSTAAEAVLSAFAIPFEICGQVLDIGASLGMAISPAHGIDAEELISSADFALQHARTEGGRSVRMFDPAMRSEAASRRALLDELRRALRNEELELHYQPQVHMVSNMGFGLEARVRWRHPERGLLLPGSFLPALEQSALALEIGWWTLYLACRDAASLIAGGQSTLKMGVNLFPAPLHSPALQRRVAEAFERRGLKPEYLELEVTETTALRDDDKSLQAMNMLREMGVGVAFDDFGTGYASLSSLQRYPLTTLKIDRGFIRDLLSKPRDAAITRALVSMSRELGLETISEGIETPEQEAFVMALGCDAGQGYRYGKAIELEHIQSLLWSVPSNRVSA